jgi:abequosyltransferase
VTAIRLSICIPVYNFGAFIGQTLESIVRQAPEDVEIIVLDGASTDDTTEVVRGFERQFPRLRYHRLEKRGGIDRDMARSVALARGEYVWLFSGDDLMREGAIARVLSELRVGCDVILLESMLCTLEMKPTGVHQLLRIPQSRVFRLHDAGERLDYFERSLNTAAFFSFCSALVVKKSRWDAASADESFFGTCFAHAARIFSMLPNGLTVKYLRGPFLDKRGGNDSFLINGLTSRYGIAVDGYHRIADRFFGHDSREAFYVRRAVRAEQPWIGWLSARLEMISKGLTEQYPLFKRLVWKQYADPSLKNWAAFATIRFTPLPVLWAAKRALDAWKRARLR